MVLRSLLTIALCTPCEFGGGKTECLTAVTGTHVAVNDLSNNPEIKNSFRRHNIRIESIVFAKRKLSDRESLGFGAITRGVNFSLKGMLAVKKYIICTMRK